MTLSSGPSRDTRRLARSRSSISTRRVSNGSASGRGRGTGLPASSSGFARTARRRLGSTWCSPNPTGRRLPPSPREILRDLGTRIDLAGFPQGGAGHRSDPRDDPLRGSLCPRLPVRLRNGARGRVCPPPASRGGSRRRRNGRRRRPLRRPWGRLQPGVTVEGGRLLRLFQRHPGPGRSPAPRSHGDPPQGSALSEPRPGPLPEALAEATPSSKRGRTGSRRCVLTGGGSLSTVTATCW